MSNVDNYPLSILRAHWKVYTDWLENQGDIDIEFPKFKITFK